MQVRSLHVATFVLATAAVVAASRSVSAQLKFPGGIVVQMPNGRNTNPRQLPGRPDPSAVCPPMLQWERQFAVEYPGVDTGRTLVDKLEQMAVPLFADAAFTPYFGKSYAALSPDELDTIHRNTIACQTSNYRGQFQMLSTLMWAFSTRVGTHTLSPGRLQQQVQALQQTRARMGAAQAQIAALPPTAASAATLAQVQAQIAPNLPLLWPSERTAFEKSVTAAQAALAVPVFAAKAGPVLAAPASTQALEDLQELRPQADSLPAAARESWQRKIDARFRALLPPLMAAQKQQMLSFRGTPEGLQDGAAWLDRFQATFVNRFHAPGAEELVTQYQAIRDVQLAAQEPGLRRRIDASASTEALDGMLDAAFPLQSDKRSAAYARLQQAVGTRREHFERQEQVAQAAREQAEARREAQLRGKPGPPERGNDLPAKTVARRTGGSAPAAAAATMDFSAKGLANEPMLSAMYRGDFDKVPYERDDLQFTAMLGGYMNAYWDQCSDFLTQDRTAIMQSECTQWWVNGWGVRTSCARYESFPTGKFADRALYQAENALTGQTTKKYLSQTIATVTNAKSLGDLFGGGVSKAAGMAELQSDMADVIRKNGCTSPALMRLQNNMQLFALGRQGIQPDGGTVRYAAAEAAAPGETFQDSNYGRLLEDLIARQSQSWLVNRYVPGSVAQVQVASRDSGGRPAKVTAAYAFQGISGRDNGTVTMRFRDGIPECLYFSDLPANCITPDRRIVASYGHGEYRAK